MRRSALCVTVVLAGCGDDLIDPFYGLARLTGESPFAAACGAGARGVVFPGTEVEPQVAVDPRDPRHLVAVWQQDRWSNGGARGIGAAASRDGGRTWTRSTPPIGRCAGAPAAADYERASDPWVTFAGDGVVHLDALVFDVTTARNAMVATRSRDGVAWSAPVALIADDDADVFNDKNAITADPTDPGRIYAVWDRVTGVSRPTEPIGTGPVVLARATDGAWEPARPIFDPGVDQQTIGNVIAVLPDGTVIDAFTRIANASAPAPQSTIEVIRSADHGVTWSAPIRVAALRTAGVREPVSERRVRTGAALPELAVDRRTGALYLAWEAELDREVDAIVLARSTDGGLTWSAPARVNGEPEVAAFTPGLAVAPDGTIGVSYFDLRDASGGFRAWAWLATSADGGQTWHDEPTGGSFALAPALLVETYFLGDYQGLAATAAGFVPVFVGATPWETDHTDVFARPLD